MKHTLLRLLDNLDALTSRVRLGLFPEGGCLVTILFHGLFRDTSEIQQNLVLPGQRMTVNCFDAFIEYFQKAGYQFVSPIEVQQGLDPAKKSIMITFDDGYYSNLLAIPVLEKYEVPAVCFVATYYVEKVRSYWWDVLYREGVERGIDCSAIESRMEQMKENSIVAIESELQNDFGENCFTPRSDIDRPFTVRELQTFASHPLVHIGNHTHRHEILTNLTYEEAKDSIEKASSLLENWNGETVRAFSYPNGNVPEYSVQLMRELNFPVVLGVREFKNRYASNDSRSIHYQALNRHILWGNQALAKQGARIRSDFQWLRRLAAFKHRKGTVS